MAVTFIQRLLNALFNRRKEGDAVSKTKAQPTARCEDENKTAKTVKANLKEKHKVETEAEAEERIRTCAAEIKDCIDLINNSGRGAPDKSKKSRGRTKTNDRRANKSTANRKTSGSRNRSDKRMEESKRGVSPAEMVRLLAKAEKNVSKAVVKAKAQDDNKKKGRPGKRT